MCVWTYLENNPRNTFAGFREWGPRVGDCIAAWSDVGFDASRGGLAAFLISVQRGGNWETLQAGGVYDKSVSGNDSLRMEAIGMEMLMQGVMQLLAGL